MKKHLLLMLCLTLGIIGIGAQDSWGDEEFLVPPPAKTPWLLDWGGTLSPAALYEHQNAYDSLVASLGGNLWLRLSLPDQWLVYARIQDNALFSIMPEAPAGELFENLWEVNAAYIQSTIPEAGLTLSLGRKSFFLGSGLALSGYGDGVEFQLAISSVTLKALGFYTGFINPGFSPFSMNSWDDANGARRYFGAYSAGLSLLGQEISLLGLYQGDFGLDADMFYTSWYTGLQLKGLVLGGEYLTEWYLEDGYSPLETGSASIAAFAGTCRYSYILAMKGSLSISAQYSLASGDADRLAAQGSLGNTSGEDTGFQAFGQLARGFVFRPYFSNIQIASLSLGINPLASASGSARSLHVALKYLYYAKYDKTGLVNTGQAALPSLDLGHGLDLVSRWSPYNDAELSLNAGLFLPGNAFPDGEAIRYAISGGLSVLF